MSQKLKLQGQLMLLAFSVVMLSGLSGCVTGSTAPAVVRDYCELVYPITYDAEHDTAPTVKEIEKHNSVYVCICENDCPTGAK